MPSVKVKEGEPIEVAMRRLKRIVEKAGYPKEWRKRECFIPGSARKQRAKAAARKRLLKRLSKDSMQHAYAIYGQSRDK